jgi:hypothetical protein
MAENPLELIAGAIISALLFAEVKMSFSVFGSYNGIESYFLLVSDVEMVVAVKLFGCKIEYNHKPKNDQIMNTKNEIKKCFITYVSL